MGESVIHQSHLYRSISVQNSSIEQLIYKLNETQLETAEDIEKAQDLNDQCIHNLRKKLDFLKLKHWCASMVSLICGGLILMAALFFFAIYFFGVKATNDHPYLAIFIAIVLALSSEYFIPTKKLEYEVKDLENIIDGHLEINRHLIKCRIVKKVVDR
ncbi:hypothetical protein [Desulfogranum japonicum]|uniref:hypothetical protein n=1 Tax=Desulfogranum japonicum TaxID=231447 RepID=UPI00048D76B5|nr:hypothetical protein [Desulfogranum japonicum]